jgi:protein TonB
MMAYDFNDIVFEGRNKEYGAYEIRRRYPKHVRNSLIIAICSFVFILFLPKIIQWITPKEEVMDIAPKMVTINTLDAPPPLDESKPPPPPPPMDQPQPKVEQYVPPVITDKKVDAPPPPKNEDLQKVQTSDINQEGTDVKFEPPKDEVVFKKPDDDNKIYEVVPQQAEFPGGMDNFRKFLLDNLTYPQFAYDNRIQGQVWLEATVSKDGSLSDIKVLKGNSALVDEAIRVLKKSPKWQPGMMNGHIVNSKIRVPITFKITQ